MPGFDPSISLPFGWLDETGMRDRFPKSRAVVMTSRFRSWTNPLMGIEIQETDEAEVIPCLFRDLAIPTHHGLQASAIARAIG